MEKRYGYRLMTCLAIIVVVFLTGKGESAEVNLNLEKQANPEEKQANPEEKQANPVQNLGENSPLKLEDAIRLALQYHPRLKGAQEDIGAQNAVVKQELASYFPTVDFNNFYRTGTASGSTSNAARGFDFLSSSAEFEMMLFDFGKRQGSVQSARDTLDATRYGFRVAVDDVILAAKEAYYTVLLARATLKVREEAVNNRELLVRQAKAFFEVGTRSKIDVARAEANLFSAQADLIAAQNAVKVAWASLKNAMGLKEFPERPLVYEPETRAEPMTLDEAKTTALTSRPELLQSASELKAQDQNLAVARRRHLPDISIRTAYGGRTASRERSAYPLRGVWQVQINFEVPIFNGFRTTNEVQEALHNYSSLKAKEEETKQQIALEVERSYLALIEAKERIEAREAARRAAKENLDLSQGRYQVGVGSIIEVTDAQTLYTDAQTEHLLSIFAFKIAEARLTKAMGRR